jgi:hypothetical protein
MPTVKELEALFAVNAELGELIRQGPTRGRDRQPETTERYRRVRINGMQYRVHIIVWMLINREPVPVGYEVDHINRQSTDNRPCNLRLATRIQNITNRGLYHNNRSGYKGVTYSRGKFLAQIAAHGVHHHLGTFSTDTEAADAYDQAALELHGTEFALTNARLGLLPPAPTALVQAPVLTGMQPAPSLHELSRRA